MAKTGLTFKVHIVGVRETLAKFNALPKDASAELRTRTKELAQTLADAARRAALVQGSQAALMVPTIKALKDRLPAVQAGGTRRVGRYGKPAFKLLFGSEFGMNEKSGWYGNPRFRASTGFQYHPHTGQRGAWFFPTVEREAPVIVEAWQRTADDIIDRFSEGD